MQCEYSNLNSHHTPTPSVSTIPLPHPLPSLLSLSFSQSYRYRCSVLCMYRYKEIIIIIIIKPRRYTSLWRLNSLASRLFRPPFVQGNIARFTGHFWGESVSIWWYYHRTRRTSCWLYCCHFLIRFSDRNLGFYVTKDIHRNSKIKVNFINTARPETSACNCNWQFDSLLFAFGNARVDITIPKSLSN